MNIFWNRDERRPRALWRLSIQSIIMFFLSGVASLAMIMIMYVIPETPIADLTQPDSSDSLMRYLMLNPYASLAFILTSFLAVFISVWLGARLLDKRPLAAFGFHFNDKWWLDLLFGLALGAVLIVMIFCIEWAAGWIVILPPSVEFRATLPLLLALGSIKYILVGIHEEMMSRGYHLVNLAEGFSLKAIGKRKAVWFAYVISSVVFGLLHLGNPNMSFVSTLNLCIAGLFLGLPFLLTGELALSIGLHITWNYFQGYIFGFPVSGLPPSGSLITIQQAGPSLWTGGSFGPEAGLLSLMVMLIGAGLVVLWVRRTRGKVDLDERIGVYQQKSITSEPFVS